LDYFFKILQLFIFKKTTVFIFNKLINPKHA
jgi:hypothetical protein